MYNSRKRNKIAELTFTLLLVILLSSSCSEKKPNVLFILTDQWRGSALGYAGDPNVKTPHLDQFSTEAITFTNVVSVCPVCTPYRASILTGRYPTSTGMFLNDAYLPPDELTLAEVYKENGYQTGYIGKWHLDGHGRFDFTPPERRQGFDYWKALECSHKYNKMAYYEGTNEEVQYWDGYSAFAVSKDAEKYIADRADDEDPFFLFLALATPHFPHRTAPDDFKKMYDEENLIIPPNVPEALHEQTKKEMIGYYAHCTATDKAIGELLDKIEDLDLMEKTVIVFTSDHGESLGAQGVRITQKQVPWIETAGVPLIIHSPEAKKDFILDLAVTTPDISNTLLELSGITPPPSFEGRSFLKNIETQNDDLDKAALYMLVSNFASVKPEIKKPYRAVKTANYTYVKSLEGPWFLFDDKKDPYQMNNLVSNPDYQDLLAKLDGQLSSELDRINDDFRPTESYLEEWGFTVTKGGYISYVSYDQKPQMPERKSK